MQSTKLKEGQGKREGERPERRLRPGKSLERGSTVQYRLNHIQRALVVVVIGAMTGNGFDGVAGVTHGERKRRHAQHFGVVAAIANRHTLLRRQLPAFQQTGNALCRPGIIRSTKPKPLVTGFMMPSRETCSLSISCGMSLSGKLSENLNRVSLIW